MTWKLQNLPYPKDLETLKVLKLLPEAHRALAELKGVAQSIPRQDILINTLAIQEAKDSSEVENIVTTHDEIYKASIGIEKFTSSQAKEVQNYIMAMKTGYQIVAKNRFLSINHIKQIQEILEDNNAGFRKVPGTTLKNQRTDVVVYTPPQSHEDIVNLMQNLETFINTETSLPIDHLIKMAVFHFQFESIHPFYDGNGRTGRILNILYLIQYQLLDTPILYLSKYIIQHKNQYYQLLQQVRDTGEWEAYLCYMLIAITETAKDTLEKVKNIKKAMADYKTLLRENYKFYSQDLLNHLFKQPYTKIEFLQNELHVSRITAANYLNQLAEDGHLTKYKIGRTNYYVNDLVIKALN
ncbi:MAG: addiction module protein [Xanthomarina sp.]|uniref:Fic family protein n=1 Tax=Xanthomarina sp. TaxID=1931211 RepID=UPI000C660159|nr:Fic family protein [Xanthomarina sp.]MAL23206.1 addiction module protein [Xanthomarina sp.]MBF60651.1 addiction module protein [Xanthomarina sp.]HAB29021.1 addiction module protein [Xanthomarina gelatinilytica]